MAHILALIMAPALEFLFYPASTTAEEQWAHNRKKTEQGERSALSKGNRSRHGQFPNLKLFLKIVPLIQDGAAALWGVDVKLKVPER